MSVRVVREKELLFSLALWVSRKPVLGPLPLVSSFWPSPSRFKLIGSSSSDIDDGQLCFSTIDIASNWNQ